MESAPEHDLGWLTKLVFGVADRVRDDRSNVVVVLRHEETLARAGDIVLDQ